MSLTLTSALEADASIAQLFAESKEQICHLTVSEDKCFKTGRSLPLGEISVKLSPEGISANSSSTKTEKLQTAVRRGEFQWKVPPTDKVRDQMCELINLERPGNDAKGKDKDNYRRELDRLRRTLDNIASIAWKLGLTHPTFDSTSVEEMPFRRATTVIADTSGVVQGALDFVARFLHPAARIKVPAVVHMEVVNQADRFLRLRRAPKLNRSATLLDHVISQGGQRVLLRIELHSDAEIERSPIFGDPLRNAFQQDRDAEWGDLNLSVPLRSYCDRLVLETVRQHQTQVSPGHPVRLTFAPKSLEAPACS
jgi:hypothetical protein